jgi:hypothetical protein
LPSWRRGTEFLLFLTRRNRNCVRSQQVKSRPISCRQARSSATKLDKAVLFSGTDTRMAIMHGSTKVQNPYFFDRAGTEKLAPQSQPVCRLPFAEGKALSTQDTPCTCHDCNSGATGMPLSRPAVVHRRRQGFAAPFSILGVERGKNMQESRRRTHQAAGRRQFSASRRGGGGRGAAQRGARAATTTDRDTRPRAAPRARQDVSARHGPESLASACWGGPGSGRRAWALPPVFTAWRCPPAAARCQERWGSSGSGTGARPPANG